MPPRPHILFLNEFFHPDICASAVVAADHLPKIAALRPDWRITILTGNRAWDDPQKVHPPREEYQGVDIVRVDRPSVSRKSLLLRGLGFAAFQRSALRAAASLDRVDLVIGTTAPPQGGSIARKIACRFGCPYIYKVLDLYPDVAVSVGTLRDGSFIHRRWLAADTKAMREAAAVVTISTPIAERIARARGIEWQKLSTIHDGYDAARLRISGPNRFAAEHNPRGRFVVQYAGNMGLSHPMDTLLAAAGQLRNDDGILFQFIGGGPQRAAIERAGLPNVQLIDYQPADRLGEILAAADVCLISQHAAMFDQAMPYKVYAILAAGRPLIFVGGDSSEIAGWIHQYHAGRTIPHGSASALASAIRDLRQQAAFRDTSASAARRLFEDRFNSSRSAGDWADLFDRYLPPP